MSLREGQAAWDRGAFFEAHEHWEAVWLQTEGAAKRWIQGLIQLAAAALKAEQHKLEPAYKLLERGLAKLEGAPATLDGVDVTAVRALVTRLLPQDRRGG